jgi:hypothetical protein
MSTDTATQKAVGLAAFVGLLGVVLATGLLLRAHGPGNMGNGLLVGAGIGLAGCAVALWRLTRHPERTTTLERAWSQTGDERDELLLTRSLAVLGISSLPMTGVAAIAVALGTPSEMAFALLLFGLIGVFAVAFAVTQRRS